MSNLPKTAQQLLGDIPTSVGEKIRTLSVHHVERGIFPSEMVAVTGIAELLGVERIIESGRWLGYSTEVLSRYFSTLPVHIDSIELWRTNIAIECERRLATCSNVHLYYGDTLKMLPGMLDGDVRKTLVLIDGPKGAIAVALIEKIIRQYPQIVAVFLHDSYKGSEARASVERAFPDAGFTDDPNFVKRFSSLDGEVPFEQHIEKCSGVVSNEASSQSYGATFAVIVPDPARVDSTSRLVSIYNRFLFVYAQAEAYAKEVASHLLRLFRHHR